MKKMEASASNSSTDQTFEDLLIAYESYAQIIDRLQHFNQIQTTYRTYAFSWMIATFIGVGYSLSSQEINLPFNPLIVVMLLCLASASGIFLIWYMDLMMCERKIATALFEGQVCEQKYPWLPKITESSNIFHSLWGYVNLKCVLYIGFFAIIFGAFGAAFSIYLKFSRFFILAPIISLFIFCFLSFFIIKSTKDANPYEQLKKMHRR